VKKAPVCDYVNYDGVKYEEDKATFRKHSTPKSRSCYSHNCDNYDEIDWSKKRIETESK